MATFTVDAGIFEVTAKFVNCPCLGEAAGACAGPHLRDRTRKLVITTGIEDIVTDFMSK